MDKIRVGIIGVGQIGKAHVREYQAIPGAEIIAVADINEARQNRVAAEYKIPNVYTNFHEMLKRDDIQAVDVCMHNNFHMPATVAALEAGKDVFCEKPMAGSWPHRRRQNAGNRQSNWAQLQHSGAQHL